MPFTLAIIGRPNVGKSTLFNRLVGKKLALVHDTPGLTRDWRMAEAEYQDYTFNVIDTAGLEEHFDASIEGRMRQQTERALERADMAILVVDVRTGITPMDRHFADWLRKQKIPRALIVNKCESQKALEGLFETYELGMGEPIPLSAEHGDGMGGLYDLLEPHLKTAAEEDAAAQALLDAEEDEDTSDDSYINKYEEGTDVGFGDEEPEEEEETKPIKVAIVGRPNVGKSTLLNALVGEERSMTGPEAGITRDAVHVDWTFEDRAFRLVDTAGLRKRARVSDKIEKMAVADTLRAVRLAQVVVMVIDGTTLFELQDLKIASHAVDEGRAFVIAVNKWDQVEDKEATLEEINYQIGKSLPQIKKPLVVTLSALTGKRVDTLMENVIEAYRLWNARVPTGRLNRWLRLMESHVPPPLVAGRANRLRYMTQVKARPPTFAMWVSRPKDYPDSHGRYIVNGLRKDFDLDSVPIRLVLKTSKNPYTD